MRFSRFPLVVAALVAVGCGAEVPDAVVDEDGPGDEFLAGSVVAGTSIADGSGEARAVLRIASQAAPEELGAAGLSAHTVAAITAARGAAFRTLAALDAVPYTGPKAWAKLLARAESLGLVAALDPCGRGQPTRTPRPLPTEVTAAASDMTMRVGTDKLEIWARSSKPFTDALIEDFRTRACAALSFDLDELEVEPDAAELVKEPIRVIVLDDETYDAVTDGDGTDGETFSPTETEGDAFVVPATALSDAPELDDTLAHELTHVFQDRFASDNVDLPWYLIEGTAIDMGTHFGMARDGHATGFVEDYLRPATGEDAKTTFRRYDLEDLTQDIDEVGHDQAIGGFFVEYVRALYPHDGTQGWPRTQALLFAAMRQASAGSTMTTAFRDEFQANLPAIKQAYIAFLDATAGDWDARTTGTVFH